MVHGGEEMEHFYSCSRVFVRSRLQVARIVFLVCGVVLSSWRLHSDVHCCIDVCFLAKNAVVAAANTRVPT